MERYLKADWPAPTQVHAYTTLRQGGASSNAYKSFNLSFGVDDDEQAVAYNRQLLLTDHHLKQPPLWLDQIHSNIALDSRLYTPLAQADALFTHTANQVCVVTTADCLPVLISSKAGSAVAAIHAGWRGLLSGIIANTVHQMAIPGHELLAWLGPGISAEVFEVGNDVYDLFTAQSQAYEVAFKPKNNQKWLADLYLIARMQLKQLGITQIFGGQFCTYQDVDRFYSYRRDGKYTGRMATLIWFDNDASKFEDRKHDKDEMGT